MAAVLRRALLLLIAVPFAAHAQTPPLREVNVTTDSAPGLIPSVAQSQQVERATANYFAAIDRGDFHAAYAMMAPVNRAAQNYAEFARDNGTSRASAGKVRTRAVLKVTWTKDPANAPFPGIYAAVDVAARFDDVDRQCGYLVWYQKSEGDGFTVMRIETNRIANAVAAQIEREKSRAELDRVWAQLSANCPNYVAMP